MKPVELALIQAQEKIDQICDQQLRDFSTIIFAPTGTKVPKTSIEHAIPLAKHQRYDEFMNARIVAQFAQDPQAAGKLCDAVNIIHAATGGTELTIDMLISGLGAIMENVLRAREGYYDESI